MTIDRLYGMQLCESPLMVEPKVGRVRGGYLNRWLIRGMVTTPARNAIVDRINNRIYMHPEMIRQLQIQLRNKYPTL